MIAILSSSLICLESLKSTLLRLQSLISRTTAILRNEYVSYAEYEVESANRPSPPREPRPVVNNHQPHFRSCTSKLPKLALTLHLSSITDFKAILAAVMGSSTTTVTSHASAEPKQQDRTSHDFFWTYTEEPHRTRRQAIIRAHPEVTSTQLMSLALLLTNNRC